MKTINVEKDIYFYNSQDMYAAIWKNSGKVLYHDDEIAIIMAQSNDATRDITEKMIFNLEDGSVVNFDNLRATNDIEPIIEKNRKSQELFSKVSHHF